MAELLALLRSLRAIRLYAVPSVVGDHATGAPVASNRRVPLAYRMEAARALLRRR